MKDSVIWGTGNSRYLKSVADFKTLYPTYDDFVAALVAGTLPIDLNGINTAGFQQVGDALGKATLLKDSTANMLGLGEGGTPADAFEAIKGRAIFETTMDATTNVDFVLPEFNNCKKYEIEVYPGINGMAFANLGFYSFDGENYNNTRNYHFEFVANGYAFYTKMLEPGLANTVRNQYIFDFATGSSSQSNSNIEYISINQFQKIVIPIRVVYSTTIELFYRADDTISFNAIHVTFSNDTEHIIRFNASDKTNGVFVRLLEREIL